MDKTSKQKLYDAGYVFYRAMFDQLTKKGGITYSNSHGCWRSHSSGYKSNASTLRALDEILKTDPKAIAE